MADKKLNIKVGTKGTDKAKKKLKGVEGGLKSLGKQAMVAGAAFFGARAIIGGLKAVIKLAGEQEQAEKKLSTALGYTSNSLLAQATALQKVTTFGDEAIIGVQASLAAFLDSEEAIKKATEATLDISVAMGMDLKSAGDLVAKTLGSSTNAMSRYGIQVEGAVGSTERLESLTGNVAKLFGGQAKAQAETMAGAISQMNNAIGDAGETIGSVLSPAVIDLSAKLKNAAIFWGDLFKKSKKDVETSSEQIKRINRSIEARLILLQDEELLKKRAETSGRTLYQQEAHELLKIAQLRADVIRLQREEVENLTKHQAAKEEFASFSREMLGIHREHIPVMREFNDEWVKLSENQTIFNEETAPVTIDALQGIWLQLSQGIPFLKSVKDGFVDVDTTSADAVGNMMGSLSQLNEATAGSGKKSKAWAKTQKALLVGESIMHTYSAAIKMLDPKYGGAPPLNYIQAAAIITAGLAKLVNIKSQKFAKGGEFVTNKPEMIMVGEAGREHVKITPIDRPPERALGGGSTINFYNPIMTEDFTRDQIIPQIEKATRLNLA